jgi:photosystem II stability/assembly factor-like uncharacterized protein
MDKKRGWSWMASSEGGFTLLHTADGGSLWKDVSPKNYLLVYPGAFFLDSSTAWVPSYDTASNALRILHTIDGGASWKEVTRKAPFARAEIHFQDEHTGWAVALDAGAGNAYYQVFETKDSGATWIPVALSGPTPEVGGTENVIHLCNICGDSFYYDPHRMVIAYGDFGSMEPGEAVRLSVSTDRGKTWQNQRLDLPSPRLQAGLISPFRPTFFSDGNGILPARILKYKNDGSMEFQVEAFFRTTDGGLHWVPIPTIVENVNSTEPPEFLSQQEIFLRCGPILCGSQDGAKTWKSIPTLLNFDTSASEPYVTAYQFIDSLTCWAIVTSGDLSTLFQTMDGGATWLPLNPQWTT